MSRPSVNILVNLSTIDTPCTNPAGDANFRLLGAGDYLVWRDAQQMGGDLLTGTSYPVIIPDTGDVEASKMFLMDYDVGEYEQIILAGTSGGSGGGDYRYVCAAWFSGPTVTIPYLEAYDDSTHLTWYSKPLGYGTPANSCFKAIATTNGSPGSATWAGTPLAGEDSRIALDTVPVALTKYLYWNIRQLMSSWMVSWATEDWYNTNLVFAIHYTYA